MVDIYKNGYCLVCGSHMSFKTTSYVTTHERTEKHKLALLESKTFKFEETKVNCPCSEILIKLKSLKLHKKSQKHMRYIQKFNNNEELVFDG